MKQAFVLKASIRLDRLFEAYRANSALIGTSSIQTFGDVEDQLQNVIFNLRHAGVRRGDRLAVFGPNSELHLYLFLASWIMGFLYIPLDFKAPLSNLLSAAKFHFLITEVKPQAETTCIVIGFQQIMRRRRIPDQDIKRPAIPFRREASAIFTSGSTGTPRGIVHTVGNYIYSALGTNDCIGLDSSDRWLLSLPLFHVGGALIWVRTLLSGAACLLPDSLQDVERSIRRLRPTVLSLVPAQLIRLLDQKDIIPLLRQMKTIMLGGAPMPPWLIDKALDSGLPVMPTYGCTESCAQVTGIAGGSARKAYHTAGQIVPYRDIRIAKDGCIELGGKTLFNRYLHERKAGPFGKDGFFKTADAGFLDADGNLIICGRTDGVFISGGENISPLEIENQLLRQDGIITAIVVPAPHREFGLTPWAFIETSIPFDEKALLDSLRAFLPGYKLPKRIIRLTAGDGQGKMKHSREALTRQAAAMAERERGA
jgi:O-succinylbenzoic acid--CoA ligase